MNSLSKQQTERLLCNARSRELYRGRYVSGAFAFAWALWQSGVRTLRPTVRRFAGSSRTDDLMVDPASVIASPFVSCVADSSKFFTPDIWLWVLADAFDLHGAGGYADREKDYMQRAWNDKLHPGFAFEAVACFNAIRENERVMRGAS